jgi:biotin carboxylase
MSHKLIVLGGSYLQVSFIQSAERLGYHVIVVDSNPACFCAREGLGYFHHLDFSNKTLLRDFFKRSGAISIFAPVNEFGNQIAAELAIELGYRYNSLEVVNVSSDKKLIWNKLQGSQLSMAKSYQEDDLCKEILPVIIKPTISTSSKGVSLVVDEDKIKDALEYARQSGKSQEIRIEEYIGGEQYSLETLTFKGQHHIIGVIEEHLSEAPYFFERSDILNSHDQLIKKEFFLDFVNLLLDTLGVEIGPCHIEVKVFEDKIYLIDFATRSGGWRDIMLYLAGLDYNALIIKACLNNCFEGINQTKVVKSVGAGVLCFHEDILRMKLAQEMGVIKEIHFNGQIPKITPKGLNDAYGYYFITANNKEDLKGYLPTY